MQTQKRLVLHKTTSFRVDVFSDVNNNILSQTTTNPVQD